MALTADLLDDVSALDSHTAEWDALAFAAGRPYCAPAWMLGWWHEVAPEGAHLRVALVRDGDRLACVAPFWAEAESGRYALLAERTGYPLEPLVSADREEGAAARAARARETAAAVARVLAEASPQPREIVFAGVPADSSWPRAFVEAWPGASAWALRETRPKVIPKVTLTDASVDDWLAGRSRNFRQQLRRARRRLESEGARFRLAGASDLDADLASFARLHHARWDHRGGSGALDGRVEALLRRCGRELIGQGRFRLWTLEVDGDAISSHLFLAADGGQSYWLGGFDDAWARDHPSIQVLVEALRHGISLGERWFELGPGGQPYKYRLADSEDRVSSWTLAPKAA
jgi:CelD/BcsL family acetyltransferase involved in cellulose biosynthesis